MKPSLQLSIIVAVYKPPERLLRRCLDSILNQSLRELELIAVDDASPDGAPAILDEYARRDPRVKVIHRSTNGRAGAARNDGLDAAAGEYVLFADADDALEPDMCGRLLELAESNSADIVSSGWLLCDIEGNVVARRVLPDDVLDLADDGQRAVGYRRLNYALWNKLFRRELLRDIRFESFEVNIGEDTLFNIEALCKAEKLVTTAYAGYRYTVHSASVTRTKKDAAYLRTLMISSSAIREVINRLDPSRVGRRFSDRILLKRFATGWEWIAEAPAAQQVELRNFWIRYFDEQLVPGLHYRGIRIVLTRAAYSLFRPSPAAKIIRTIA